MMQIRNLFAPLALVALAGCGGSGGGSGTATAAPTITSQPVPTVIQAGQNVTFSVGASGGGLSYQWFETTSGTTTSGVAINRANFASYTIVSTPLQTTTPQFYVTVTNSLGSVTSNVVQLTVVASTGSGVVTVN